ncbi:hypothetical protein VNO77_22680 [Canavalia gladiata]|uniref:Uncharacterized protein n=1 Tax=Canavalia gladiata TaxID=3824 RepID=A0AAN9L8A3_CANGL
MGQERFVKHSNSNQRSGHAMNSSVMGTECSLILNEQCVLSKATQLSLDRHNSPLLRCSYAESLPLLVLRRMRVSASTFVLSAMGLSSPIVLSLSRVLFLAISSCTLPFC